MNTARYALWMKEAGYKVIVYGVRETPFFRQATMQGLEVKSVSRNKKYFDVLAARRLARLFQDDGVKLVWFRDTRDMDTLGWAKRFSSPSFKLLYQQAMQFGVAKRDVFHTHRFRPIDAWVSTLDFLRNQVEASTRFPKERIHVVPLGVDTSRLRVNQPSRVEARSHYGLDDGAFIFGVIGRLDPLKGQHLAIEALHQLLERGMKAQLLLVGEPTLNEGDEYAERLRVLIQQLNLEHAVHIHPYCSDVSYFYHAIDAFMLCSKGETFGTVTIEAMACALPIIGTDSSGTPEILDKGACGILVPSDNSYQLAAGMERVILNWQDAMAMGKRAQLRFLHNYSKEISVKRMTEIVDRIIGRE